MEISSESVERDAKRLFERFQTMTYVQFINNKPFLEETADVAVNRMVDEILLEVVGDLHRAIKLGYSDLVFSKIYDQSLDQSDIPFYPENVDSKIEDINCPRCHRLIHASRFAPHLEKCMAQGRSSSRIKSQRIANNYASSGYGSDGDDDWKVEKTRSVKKLNSKKKKDSVRKQKVFKSELLKNQREAVNAVSHNLKDIFPSPSKSRDNYSSKSSKDQDDVWISPNKILPLSEDKANVSSPRCGVKSDHTGKYCSRSLRCPLHSDAERAVARKMLAGESTDIDVEDIDYSKSVIGNFSQLDIAPTTPSKKKEKQKNGISKY